MNNTKPTAGLVAAATFSKKHVNQDAHAIVEDHMSGLRGVVIADGLGSHFGSHVASATAVDGIARALIENHSKGVIRMHDVFAHGADAVRGAWVAARPAAPAEAREDMAFGTTALCCVELADELLMAYVGNGALIHMRGNFNTFPASQLLPWSAINMLNPHAIPRDGKNPLYKLFGATATPAMTAPTVLRVSKDADIFGDIVIVTTDGLYSFDQTPMGRDDEGRIWISGEASLSIIFAHLDTFCRGNHSTERLTSALDAALLEMDAEGLVNDDCTVGVLFTSRALAFQRDRLVAPDCSSEGSTVSPELAAAW